jgi:hypothetical protein
MKTQIAARRPLHHHHPPWHHHGHRNPDRGRFSPIVRLREEIAMLNREIGSLRMTITRLRHHGRGHGGGHGGHPL